MSDAPSFETVAILSKNRRESLRIARGSWNGVPMIDVRIYFPGGDEGTLLPTRKGVMFRADLASEVSDAILLAGGAHG